MARALTSPLAMLTLAVQFFPMHSSRIRMSMLDLRVGGTSAGISAANCKTASVVQDIQ